MNIIIIGAGKVGYALAKYLSVEEDNVTIIDKKDEAIEHINNNIDAMCIKGNCTNFKVLQEAGIKEADLVISVTNSDELNMLSSLAAKKLGVKYTVARVRTPDFDEDITLLTEALGINLVINPEKAAAMEISKRIKFPSVISVDGFSNGKVNLVGLKVTSDINLVGKRVSDIDFIRGNVLFCGIEKGDEVIIPSGDYVFEEGDNAYVIGEHKDIQDLFTRLGKYKKRVKNTMIIGGSKISYYLAKVLNEDGVHTKIIERDLNKCEELTEVLPDSIIINGDGLDEDTLMSERLPEMDSFIALTGRDEDNLIGSLFASNKNVKNVITKITRDNYKQIANTVGINSMVSPKIVTANRILKYVRSLKSTHKTAIENVFKICNEKAEAVEFIVNEDTKNINVKLKHAKFNKNSLIAVIVRNDKIIIPSGDDSLKLNDRVIAITKDSKLLDINDIFSGGEMNHEL